MNTKIIVYIIYNTNIVEIKQIVNLNQCYTKSNSLVKVRAYCIAITKYIYRFP